MPPRRDRRRAARARLPGAAVHAPDLAAAVERRAHQRRGRLERAAAIVLADVAEPQPRRELHLPQRLGEPHVPDPGDERLVEQRLAERARRRRRRACARASRRTRGGRSRMSGPSRRSARSCSSRIGPFQRTPSTRSPRSTSHGLPTRRSPRGRTDQRPVIRRCERSDDAAREPEAQVLADRLDRFERASVDRLGDARRAAARVRRLGGDALTDERLEPTRRTVQRVALGHVSTVTRSARLSPS